jgi:hypothetical protein
MKNIFLLIALIIELSAQRIAIVDGWQLVGTETGYSDMKAFDRTCINAVWSYDTTLKSWSAYSPDNSTAQAILDSTEVSTLSNIDIGQGFWIQGNSPCYIAPLDNLNFSVTNQSSDNLSFTAIFNQDLTAFYDLNGSGFGNSNTIYKDDNSSSLITLLNNGDLATTTANFLRMIHVSNDRNRNVLSDDTNATDSDYTLDWGTPGVDTNITISGSVIKFKTNKTKTNTISGDARVSTIGFRVGSNFDFSQLINQDAFYTKTISIAAQ